MSKRKHSRILGIRGSGDMLEIRIKDSAKNTYFKKKANIENKKEIKRMLDSLRHFSIDVKEMFKEREQEEDSWW